MSREGAYPKLAFAGVILCFVLGVSTGAALACGDSGEACGLFDACCSGLVCAIPQFTCRHDPPTEGEPCSVFVPCTSDLRCINLVCKKPSGSGGACATTADCESGLVCSFPQFTCRHDPPIAGESCSVLIPCADDLACIALVCESRRKSGEGCALTSDCEEGLDCKPCFTDGCDHPFQCFPPSGHQLFDRDFCLSLYSAQVHQEAVSQNLTRSFGAGSAVTVVAAASDEVGTVYGQNGSYGCYLTTCVGAQTDIGIADFVSVGFFVSYEDFRGAAVSTVEEAGEGLVFSTSQIFTPGFGRLVGTEDCMAISVSVAPISGGIYQCNTVVETVIGNEAPVARCVSRTLCADASTCSVSASIDDGSSDPDGDGITTSPAPAGPYGIGTHTVTLTVTDPEGEHDTCSAQIRVNDCTAPTVTCPAPTIAECTSSEQAVVDPGDASATDCSGFTVSDPGEASYPVGTTQVAYVATDASDNTARCATTVTVADTTAPSLTCPAPTIAECTSPGAAVVDPGDASATDICSSASVNDPGPASYSLGTTQVTYTAADQANNSSVCATTVTVVDTTAPALVCPPPTIAECTGSGQAVVDPGDASATDICSSVSVNDPGSASYPLGATQVAYTATDQADNRSACSTVVTVVDRLPPAIAGVSAAPNVLWPPDHRMHEITVGIAASDSCISSVACGVIGVTSDESQSGLNGGRDVPDDMEIVGPNKVRLRAERDGSGDGRIYTITVECRDHTGENSVQGTVDVTVPHDRSER